MAYKDPEQSRAYGRAWMKRNPEKARAAMQRWGTRNPELRRERNRLYKRRAMERRGLEINKLKAAWLARHPEVRRVKDSNRRARERDAVGTYTATEWLALVAQYGGRCAYDGALGPLQPDHRVPLARGGTNDIANILPACGTCNRKKHLMTEEEFRQRLADEDQAK